MYACMWSGEAHPSSIVAITSSLHGWRKGGPYIVGSCKNTRGSPDRVRLFACIQAPPLLMQHLADELFEPAAALILVHTAFFATLLHSASLSPTQCSAPPGRSSLSFRPRRCRSSCRSCFFLFHAGSMVIFSAPMYILRLGDAPNSMSSYGFRSCLLLGLKSTTACG